MHGGIKAVEYSGGPLWSVPGQLTESLSGTSRTWKGEKSRFLSGREIRLITMWLAEMPQLFRHTARQPVIDDGTG
jgi:hypothetical protein